MLVLFLICSLQASPEYKPLNLPSPKDIKPIVKLDEVPLTVQMFFGLQALQHLAIENPLENKDAMLGLVAKRVGNVQLNLKIPKLIFNKPENLINEPLPIDNIEPKEEWWYESYINERRVLKTILIKLRWLW